MKFKVYEPNWKTLQLKLERLNVKLSRLGVPQIRLQMLGHVDEPHPLQANAVIRYLEVEVAGASPAFNGWEFVATLVHTTEGNIIRSVPGFTVPVEYRDRPTWCEHCKTNRLRRDTYVVRHEDGRVMQVGSSCLEEFIGCNPAGLTKGALLLMQAYDMCESAQTTNWLGGKGSKGSLTDYYVCRIDLETYLKHVAAVVLVSKRYTTRKMVQEMSADISTSDLAYNLMMGFPESPADAYPVTQAAEQLAEDARRFVLSRFAPHLGEANGTDTEVMTAIVGTLKGTNDQISDFEHNLLACARAESIEPRLCGVAAYIIEYYRRNNPVTLAAVSRVGQLNEGGLMRIFEMIASAAKTLKHPAIRLANDQGVRLCITVAGPQSKNAGCLYIKGDRDNDAYYGKVTPQGKFYPSRECPPTVEPLLVEFACNPEAVAQKYGKMTGRCCFCGLTLSDKRSTAMGYGPICADKYGLAWGKVESDTKDNPVKAAESLPCAVTD